ncbi:MAG TPA: NUDIX domain-containing protein [Flavobacterium sp.]|jgi:predicted NUDIX family NTP pyrophosphohydrolase
MKKSAGVLLYKTVNGQLKVFLVHPGGPFWKNKDLGSWSIPKGEINGNEDILSAALREFEEETGFAISGDFFPLEPVKLKSGKQIFAWAVQGDIDAPVLKSNNFEIEWPPRSGLLKQFPEVDRGDWFSCAEAMEKINSSQADLIVQLQRHLQP